MPDRKATSGPDNPVTPPAGSGWPPVKGRQVRIKSLRLNEKVARDRSAKVSVPRTGRSLPTGAPLAQTRTSALSLEGRVSLDEDSEVHDAAGVVREEGGQHPMMDNPVPTVHCLPTDKE